MFAGSPGELHGPDPVEAARDLFGDAVRAEARGTAARPYEDLEPDGSPETVRGGW